MAALKPSCLPGTGKEGALYPAQLQKIQNPRNQRGARTVKKTKVWMKKFYIFSFKTRTKLDIFEIIFFLSSLNKCLIFLPVRYTAQQNTLSEVKRLRESTPLTVIWHPVSCHSFSEVWGVSREY
jgi:hypothetical protein